MITLQSCCNEHCHQWKLDQGERVCVRCALVYDVPFINNDKGVRIYNGAIYNRKEYCDTCWSQVSGYNVFFKWDQMTVHAFYHSISKEKDTFKWIDVFKWMKRWSKAEDFLEASYHLLGERELNHEAYKMFLYADFHMKNKINKINISYLIYKVFQLYNKGYLVPMKLSIKTLKKNDILWLEFCQKNKVTYQDSKVECIPKALLWNTMTKCIACSIHGLECCLHACVSSQIDPDA